MKLFLTLALCLCGLAANAGRVAVAWTSSSTPGVTYVLYAHTNALAETNLSLSAVRAHVGTNLSATAIFTNAGRWYLVATARDTNGVESLPSNMLALEVPEPASNLRTLVVQYTVDLSLTNGWTDALFLRLKPGP